ncbi:hypothetical protein K501DRAFT_221842 [Backusella circina FSU 941]|nr:hypothetical protein K501DRAFT_221842 [Backusella circina FSU 941]
MIKIKNIFNSNKNENRTTAFTKRHEVLHHQDTSDDSGVKINDLSDIELDPYRSWWKDLNPFGLKVLNVEKVLEFILSSGLADETLNKILSLCQHQKEGLKQEEFFAVLRLISHAQQGHTISLSLVHDKVESMPRFRTEAIEISLKPRSSCETSRSVNLNSEQSDFRSLSLGQSNNSTPSQTTRFNKLHPGYGHSRSRSLPFNPFSAPQHASPFDTLGVSPVKSGQSRHGAHKSMDTNQLSQMVDTGQSLLLTRSFTPKFLSESEQTTNPFDSTGSSPQTPAPATPTYPNIIIHTNDVSNKYREPPPPVPPQSTKPDYPKYAHNNKK